MPYTHLTSAERCVIDSMWSRSHSFHSIARALGRSPSTISREVRRNIDGPGQYNPHLANVLYWRRRERLVKRPKTENPWLMGYVRRGLKKAWSPEQIAGRLRMVLFPKTPKRWLSHETIYRYVWMDKCNGGKLYRLLRRGRRKYSRRGKVRHPNRFIKGRVSIDERPAAVQRQERIGDWEGDTIYGRRRRSCLATLVERKTLFLTACKMPDATAPSLNRAILKCLTELPKALVRTLTVDNGKEFSRFKEIEERTGVDVYFTHPYCAWERPINENHNGLLRQFLPKKTDLNKVSDESLQRIIEKLNNRPRKKLNYRTPQEVFQEAIGALEG